MPIGSGLEEKQNIPTPAAQVYTGVEFRGPAVVLPAKSHPAMRVIMIILVDATVVIKRTDVHHYKEIFQKK